MASKANKIRAKNRRALARMAERIPFLRWRVFLRYYVQRACLWYLFRHRGYDATEPITLEGDRAVMGLLRWSRSPFGSGHPGRYIATMVRWA